MVEAAAGGGDGAVTTPPAAPTCPVCMEPWTCDGDHRICCIPCGHVYGRSCLEKWLHRSGDSGAKCPQCGEQFEHKVITNLYAPGNLWDGVSPLQEVKAHYQSEVCGENAGYRFTLDKVDAALVEMSALLTAGNKAFEEFVAKSTADSEVLRADSRQKLDEIKRMWNEEKATTKANLTTMKERMKKMAEEEKATATDLIEFMELSFPQLPLFSEDPHASASAPADSQNNTRRRSNSPDQLPPVPEPPGPADAVNKRRRRET